MSNYRGLIWSLVAIAGTATAATMAYRYATRSTRPRDDDGESDENETVHGNGGSRRNRGSSGGDQETRTRTQFVGDDDDDAQYESLSEEDYDDAFSIYDEDDNAAEMQQQQQQLVLMAREGNLLLSVFGVVLMILVGAVSLIITWTSDEIPSPADLPMFAPLMWIAVGIFTGMDCKWFGRYHSTEGACCLLMMDVAFLLPPGKAASVEVLSNSALTTPEIPVLTEKAVFPSDESDFELIRQHNDESLAAAQSPKAAPNASNDSDCDRNNASKSQQPSSSGPSASHNGKEKKAALSSELAAILKRADDLSEQSQHWDAREYLLSVLPEYSDEVEVLWRLARAAYTLGEEKTDEEEKKAFAFEGLTFAEKAAVGNFRDLKEKIAGAYVIRDHTERAIELNPSDPTAYHILANWSLAFADMTWIEKKAAAALFGTPPTATYEDVVKNLLAAENLNPGGWKKNSYLLAETYSKMKKPSEAAKWLFVAKDVPIKTKEDDDAQKLVVALMKKLKVVDCAFGDSLRCTTLRFMEMPPREALVPLLKLAGTAAVAAIAYRYGSKHVVAAAYRQHGGRVRSARQQGQTTKKSSEEEAGLRAEEEEKRKTLDAMAAAAAGGGGKSAEEQIAPEIPRSSLVVAMLLQDGYLLVSVFGVLVMVLAVLVSLAIVSMNDAVASLDELQMFAPLMCIGMGLVAGTQTICHAMHTLMLDLFVFAHNPVVVCNLHAVGMVNSMLRGSPKKKRGGARSASPARCPFSGATASVPMEKSPRREGDSAAESEESEDGETTEKRVSKCPFGFG